MPQPGMMPPPDANAANNLSQAAGDLKKLPASVGELQRQVLDAAKFDDACSVLRGMLREAGRNVLSLKNHPQLVMARNADALGRVPEEPDKGEMIANLQLAYRHIEDAIMRLGKAIQAYDGGKSVYGR